MTERRMMFIIHTQPNWLLNRGRHLATCPVFGVHFSTGRVGKPDDIAAIVHYLISPQAAFITG